MPEGIDVITTPTTHTTNAVHEVIELPELIEHIGLYLQPSDLFSCIQVNRLLKQTLIPLLWHTIDTLSEPWLRIINDEYSEERPKGEIEEWVQMVVAKHGHHIQDLTVHWSTVLEAVSFDRECRNLRSLAMVNVGRSNSTGFSVPFPSNMVLERITEATTNARKMNSAVDPQLPWVQGDRGNTHSKAVERYFLERFWALIRQSPYLARLSFPKLRSMHDLPQEFILDSLMSLHHLRDLNVEWLSLDVRSVLRSLPKLERIRVPHLRDLLLLLPGEQLQGLRMLGVRRGEPLSCVFEVLEHLPGLEELRLQEISREPFIWEESIGTGAKARLLDVPALKTLQYDKVPSRWEDMYIAELVGRLSGLSRIKVPMLLRATEQALWDRCYFLEEIDSLNGRDKIGRWRMRREVGEEDEDEDTALEAELA